MRQPSSYTRDVPTLTAYLDGREIFRSDGPWLYPLLELSHHLGHRPPKGRLVLHDKVVGRAGALLSARLGAREIHTELLSRLAVPVLDRFGVRYTAVETVDRILCATEDLFADLVDPEEAYQAIEARLRARRTAQSSGATSAGRAQSIAYRDAPVASDADADPLAVEVRELVVSRGARRVLAGAGLSLAAGETVLIRGRNGAGKTTLLRTILGLIKPDSGTVLVRGVEVGSAKWHRVRSSVAYVRQLEEPTDLPISVREVVLIGAEAALRHGAADRSHDPVTDALRRVRAAHLERRLYRTLSGGERQRVAIARALAQSPVVLLLDEPTVGLDADARNDLIRLLDGLAVRNQVGVIVVSHDLEPEELPHARAVTLVNGRIGDTGSP